MRRRPPLAVQADLWQGLHTFSSAGPRGPL